MALWMILNFHLWVLKAIISFILKSLFGQIRHHAFDCSTQLKWLKLNICPFLPFFRSCKFLHASPRQFPHLFKRSKFSPQAFFCQTRLSMICCVERTMHGNYPCRRLIECDSGWGILVKQMKIMSGKNFQLVQKAKKMNMFTLSHFKAK